MFLSSYFSEGVGDDSLKWIFSNNGFPFLVLGIELQHKRDSVTKALGYWDSPTAPVGGSWHSVLGLHITRGQGLSHAHAPSRKCPVP